MSQDKSAPEPSMEEILSSIRRIIADEQKEEAPRAEPPGRPRPIEPAGSRAAPPPPEDDVLELTDIDEDEPAPAMASPAPSAPLEETAIVSTQDSGLVSPSAATASTNAFAKLTRSVAADERPASALAGQSVEDLLLQLLRPALKDWLDQNLPAIVERVVEQEVKKLARRAELS